MSMLPLHNDIYRLVKHYLVNKTEENNVTELIKNQVTLLLTKSHLDTNVKTLSTDVVTFNLAAEFGYLGVIQFMYRNNVSQCIPYAITLAAENGHLHVIKWFWQNMRQNLTKQVYMINGAARHGQFRIVKWLWYNVVSSPTFTSTNCKCPRELIDGVAFFGNFEIIKWLYTHCSASYSSDALVNAAYNGHFKLLQWLDSMHPEFLRDIFNARQNCLRWATCNGHIPIIDWLNKYAKQS